jgi:hypothetical protein
MPQQQKPQQWQFHLAKLREDFTSMFKPAAHSPSHKSMTFLSRLLLVQQDSNSASSSMAMWLRSEVRNISREQFDDLMTLADSNHVLVRGLEVFLKMMPDAEDDFRAEWARSALATERARITKALSFLSDICAAFESENFDVAVIKSLDHWPDLGSDLDLYTNAHSEAITKFMKRRFGAQTAPQSWGDRLAGKWNFSIPGLPEAVEIHMGRLGQTGEQVAVASRVAERSRLVMIGDYAFRVPSASDRVTISTLQRMYRHFYFRLCDIVDTAELFETGAIDFEDLRSSATNADIWEGVATYLAIVSDYVRQYRGSGLDLPHFVRSAARFGGEQVYYSRGFLRVPIMPQSVGLYGSQLAGLLRKRQLQSCARLSLLPWLATAAVVGQRITGSDKGIW